MIKKLETGHNYLIHTKGGEIYFGEYVGGERTKYSNSSRLRYVNIFKNGRFLSRCGNHQACNYIQILTSQIRDARKVDFDVGSFSGHNKEDLINYFGGD